MWQFLQDGVKNGFETVNTVFLLILDIHFESLIITEHARVVSKNIEIGKKYARLYKHR